MPGCCAVHGCTNTTLKVHHPSFHRFPALPGQEDRRKKWVNAVLTSNGGCVTSWSWWPAPTSRICGDHFISGKPNQDPDHPDYIPSVFSKKSNNQDHQRLERYNRSLKRQRRNEDTCMSTSGNAYSQNRTHVDHKYSQKAKPNQDPDHPDYEDTCMSTSGNAYSQNRIHTSIDHTYSRKAVWSPSQPSQSSQDGGSIKDVPPVWSPTGSSTTNRPVGYKPVNLDLIRPRTTVEGASDSGRSNDDSLIYDPSYEWEPPSSRPGQGRTGQPQPSSEQYRQPPLPTKEQYKPTNAPQQYADRPATESRSQYPQQPDVPAELEGISTPRMASDSVREGDGEGADPTRSATNPLANSHNVNLPRTVSPMVTSLQSQCPQPPGVPAEFESIITPRTASDAERVGGREEVDPTRPGTNPLANSHNVNLPRTVSPMVTSLQSQCPQPPGVPTEFESIITPRTASDAERVGGREGADPTRPGTNPLANSHNVNLPRTVSPMVTSLQSQCPQPPGVPAEFESIITPRTASDAEREGDREGADPTRPGTNPLANSHNVNLPRTVSPMVTSLQSQCPQPPGVPAEFESIITPRTASDAEREGDREGADPTRPGTNPLANSHNVNLPRTVSPMVTLLQNQRAVWSPSQPNQSSQDLARPIQDGGSIKDVPPVWSPTGSSTTNRPVGYKPVNLDFNRPPRPTVEGASDDNSLIYDPSYEWEPPSSRPGQGRTGQPQPSSEQYRQPPLPTKEQYKSTNAPQQYADRPATESRSQYPQQPDVPAELEGISTPRMASDSVREGDREGADPTRPETNPLANSHNVNLPRTVSPMVTLLQSQCPQPPGVPAEFESIITPRTASDAERVGGREGADPTRPGTNPLANSHNVNLPRTVSPMVTSLQSQCPQPPGVPAEFESIITPRTASDAERVGGREEADPTRPGTNPLANGHVNLPRSVSPTVTLLQNQTVPNSSSTTSANISMATPVSDAERKSLYNEMNALRAERDDALKRLEEVEERLRKASLTAGSVEGNDEACKQNTGLSWVVFLTTFNFLLAFINKKTHRKIMAPIDQLFITLLKLRTGLTFKFISIHTNVPKTSVISIFWKWLDVMYTNLSFLVCSPDPEAVRRTLPPLFKKYYPRLTCIVDCFEIFIDMPKNLKARAQTYSNYKKHNTIKVFIGCTPLGAISFISIAWGGRVTDVDLIRKSGFISSNYHKPGDQILADRGFLVEEDFAIQLGVEFLVPAFTRGKRQLSAKEVELSRKLSTIRIHIERVIGILKNRYTILQGTLPITLIKSIKDETMGTRLASIDKIIRVCACLVNLGDGIVYNEAKDSGASLVEE
ncbi:uncharacterized protein [Amphiura filiformis]|uniref:uncharacterized protein n=1 Tax=Amphiura filiformis TaxID=82378 RepID=UPI003B224248